jgi:hypothetical protein
MRRRADMHRLRQDEAGNGRVLSADQGVQARLVWPLPYLPEPPST